MENEVYDQVILVRSKKEKQKEIMCRHILKVNSKKQKSKTNQNKGMLRTAKNSKVQQSKERLRKERQEQ